MDETPLERNMVDECRASCNALLWALIQALADYPDKVTFRLEVTGSEITITVTFENQDDCARFIGRKGHNLANIRRVFHKVAHRYGYSRMMFNVVDPTGASTVEHNSKEK
jgi:predicted RNA-binding protein YlqC (UPF0109 family)